MENILNRKSHLVIVLTAVTCIITVACGSEAEPTQSLSATSTSVSSGNPTSTSSSVSTPDTTVIPGVTRTPVTSPTPVPPTSTVGPVLGPELIAGGSFESGDFSEWEVRVGTGQQIQIVDDVALVGERSLHMTSPPEGDWPEIVLRQRFFVEEGQSYQWGFSSQQNEYGPVQMLLRFYNNREEFMNGTVNSDWVTTEENSWLDVSAITTAPEGAVTAQIVIQLRILPEAVENASSNLEVYVDDVTVREVLG